MQTSVRRAGVMALLVGALLAPASAQLPDFQKGERVRVEGIDRPASVVVVAIPDDLVAADETGIYVNDVPLTGYSQALLTGQRVARHILNYDHYVVIGEEAFEGKLAGYFGIQQGGTLQRVPSK